MAGQLAEAATEAAGAATGAPKKEAKQVCFFLPTADAPTPAPTKQNKTAQLDAEDLYH